MNVAEFKGEKTVSALAKRLLAEPTSDTPKTTQVQMEAALLRLNPQLSKIGDLDKGTPIVVPDDFALDPAESSPPAGSLAAELLQQAEAGHAWTWSACAVNSSERALSVARRLASAEGPPQRNARAEGNLHRRSERRQSRPERAGASYGRGEGDREIS